MAANDSASVAGLFGAAAVRLDLFLLEGVLSRDEALVDLGVELLQQLRHGGIVVAALFDHLVRQADDLDEAWVRLVVPYAC